MKQPETVRVRMKGCHLEYESGKEYDLPIALGTWLHGIGMADYIDAPAPAAAPEVNNDRK